MRDIQLLKTGFVFDVRRIDFHDAESVVFRGQRNEVSAYLGRIDWGRILADEIEFYRLLPNLPVPRPIHFERSEAALGFPFAFFTYLSGSPLDELLLLASAVQRRGAAREMGGLLGTLGGGSLSITGIVDAANSLAGDPAFDLARVDEGVGLDADFRAGYEAVFGRVERNTEAYALYRLETAALLAHVYEGSPQEAFRRERFETLKRRLA